MMQAVFTIPSGMSFTKPVDSAVIKILLTSKQFQIYSTFGWLTIP